MDRSNGDCSSRGGRDWGAMVWKRCKYLCTDTNIPLRYHMFTDIIQILLEQNAQVASQIHQTVSRGEANKDFWNEFRGLNLSPCFLTLELTEWVFQQSAVLWALFQHCSYLTSLRAGVSVPGPSLNISHWRSLPACLQEKESHNKSLLCHVTPTL